MTISSHLSSPPFHHDHDSRDLLEDWPSNSSSSIEEAELEPKQVDEFSMATMPEPKSNPRVSFSETSLLRVYKEDEDYRYKKAYSKVDYELFRFSMLLDARRFKGLITMAPPDSKKDSVKYLLENKVIDIADLVGVEHYVLGNGEFVIKARKLHAKKVLQLQQQLKLRQHQTKDPAESLAKVSKDSSLESIHHARIRSAVVAS